MDEDIEIEQGVNDAMRALNSKRMAMTRCPWRSYLLVCRDFLQSRLCSSVDISHAAVFSRFLQHAIVSIDFPALLENNGQALIDELGITSKLHRTKIMRDLRMKLLGIRAGNAKT